jgi:hypothetical protein
VPFELPWNAPRAKGIDALGEAVPTQVTRGCLSFKISLTPIYLEPAG